MATKPVPTQKELQNQLIDLKAEILELSGQIAGKTTGAADTVQPYVDDVSHRFRYAADAAAEHGRAVYDAVKEGPRTATSVALTAGLMGLAIGWLIGSATSER